MKKISPLSSTDWIALDGMSRELHNRTLVSNSYRLFSTLPVSLYAMAAAVFSVAKSIFAGAQVLTMSLFLLPALFIVKEPTHYVESLTNRAISVVYELFLACYSLGTLVPVCYDPYMTVYLLYQKNLLLVSPFDDYKLCRREMKKNPNAIEKKRFTLLREYQLIAFPKKNKSTSPLSPTPRRDAPPSQASEPPLAIPIQPPPQEMLRPPPQDVEIYIFDEAVTLLMNRLPPDYVTLHYADLQNLSSLLSEAKFSVEGLTLLQEATSVNEISALSTRLPATTRRLEEINRALEELFRLQLREISLEERSPFFTRLTSYKNVLLVLPHQIQREKEALQNASSSTAFTAAKNRLSDWTTRARNWWTSSTTVEEETSSPPTEIEDEEATAPTQEEDTDAINSDDIV